MKKILIGLGISISLMTASAIAGDVSITTSSFVKKNKKWVKPAKVIPGTVIKYVNTLDSKIEGETTALSIINEIPKQVTYVEGSANCESKCDILFSVDGKTFDKRQNLLIENKKGKKVKAVASDYKSIKWIIKKLDGMKSTAVEYKAKIK